MAGRAREVGGFRLTTVRKVPVRLGGGGKAGRASKYSALKQAILGVNGSGYLRIQCPTKTAALKLYGSLRAGGRAAGYTVMLRDLAVYGKASATTE